MKGGISEPRNKNLFKMFNLIGIGDHAGSGVPDIFDVWRVEGLIELIILRSGKHQSIRRKTSFRSKENTNPQ